MRKPADFLNPSPSADTPQKLARLLLETRLPFLDPVRSFSLDESGFPGPTAAVIGEYPVRTLLGDDNFIPSVLGGISRSAPAGERKLDYLRDALLQLANTGTTNRDSLKVAETKLPGLIRRIRDREEVAKLGINPSEAGERAILSRILPDFVDTLSSNVPITGEEPFWDKTLTPASPNEIDAQQINSLRHVQDFQMARRALEQILDAIRGINTLLGPIPPGQGSKSR